MLRLYAITCLLGFVMFDASTAVAQRGVYRAPVTPRVTVPRTPLPEVDLQGTLTLPDHKPVVPIPPVRPQEAAPADAGMCCPCPDRDDCSDVCCIRQ